ncbi:MAG: hypothetical protein Q9225_004422 [Loekoesia sp. 1 TL-2023]
MSEKKRKRASHDTNDRPAKKIAGGQQVAAEMVKVSVLPEEDEWAPIVASTPGLSFPSDLPLKTYERRRGNDTPSTGKSQITSSEHLLHTSAHSKIDYIAREEEGNGKDGLLSHYLGVYDPQSGQLQLVRVRKLVLRSSLRSIPTGKEKAAKPPSVSNLSLDLALSLLMLTEFQGLSARNALGLTFGTKKSQRAIEALTKNAISPSKKGRGAEGQTQPAFDPIASAVISSMADTSSIPTRDELQAAADESKPRPQPNLDAKKPADVYPIERLVGHGMLPQMTIKEWQDAIESGEEILTKSRFVSHRIQHVVSGGNVRKLKTLKYLLLLLEWYGALQSPTKGGGRKLLHPEKLRNGLSGWSSSLVDGVTHRFAGGGRVVTRWHLDNLITHICALAVTVDDFTSDVYDLTQDLKLEMKDMRKYFREIGCQMGPPTEGEMKRLGVGKVEGKGRMIARLRLPLELPKMRVVRAKKRR